MNGDGPFARTLSWHVVATVETLHTATKSGAAHRAKAAR